MVKEWVYRWAMVNAAVLLIDQHSSKGIGQPLMAVVPYDAKAIAKPIFLTGAIRLFCGYIEGHNYNPPRSRCQVGDIQESEQASLLGHRGLKAKRGLSPIIRTQVVGRTLVHCEAAVAGTTDP